MISTTTTTSTKALLERLNLLLFGSLIDFVKKLFFKNYKTSLMCYLTKADMIYVALPTPTHSPSLPCSTCSINH